VRFTEIINILDNTDAKHVALLCHQNADPDAICSAYALTGLLKHIRPKLDVEIGVAQGITRLSKNLTQHFSIGVTTQPNLDRTDVIVLLDTNTIKQLGNLAEKITNLKTPIIVIDHHAAHPETEGLATLFVSIEELSSTCEIVYHIFQELGVKPNKTEAEALFLGIAFDTRHFAMANSTTFKTIAELVNAGVNTKEVLSLLTFSMDFSERVARLKASRRAKLFDKGEWIIAISRVGAYQASAARAMIGLGAHVAVVMGEKKGKLVICLRCTRIFHEKTRIHLGRDIAQPLGEQLNGMGGGHSTAAGVNGVGEIATGIKRCLQLLDKLIKN
jgi:nanoRNase/pAp phosphatase (c-di-AMP/oligoRNAs hydrolase)